MSEINYSQLLHMNIAFSWFKVVGIDDMAGVIIRKELLIVFFYIRSKLIII